jgi:outer membrane lipoprotein SlyB
MPGSVTATYRDLDQARAALTALERGGVDSSSISLEGARAARAAGRHDTAARDRGVTRQMGTRVAVGAAVGGVLGGLAGFLLGSIAFSGPTALWAALVAGTIAGGAVGAAVGGYATPAMGEEWEVTHDPAPDGPVWVRVTLDRPDELEKAAEVLGEKDPISIDRTD